MKYVKCSWRGCLVRITPESLLCATHLVQVIKNYRTRFAGDDVKLSKPEVVELLSCEAAYIRTDRARRALERARRKLGRALYGTKDGLPLNAGSPHA